MFLGLILSISAILANSDIEESFKEYSLSYYFFYFSSSFYISSLISYSDGKLSMAFD